MNEANKKLNEITGAIRGIHIVLWKDTTTDYIMYVYNELNDTSYEYHFLNKEDIIERLEQVRQVFNYYFSSFETQKKQWKVSIEDKQIVETNNINKGV